MKFVLLVLAAVSLFIIQCSYPEPEDRTPPVAQVIYPYEGAVISQNVDIILSASDNSDLDKVWAYIDGEKIGEVSEAPYNLSLNIVGYEKKVNHVIQAAAQDKAGNIGFSPNINFVIADSPDNIPPVVTLVNPQSGQVVEGIVNVVANAEDERSVQKVAFFINGDSVGVTSVYPYIYNWNTSGYSDSTEHTIYAKAFDGGNNTAISNVVGVTVYPRTGDAGDGTAPTALFLYPVAGSTVTGTVRVSVDLYDNTGVTKAEFYADGVLVTSADNPSSPWIFNWNTAPLADSSVHSIYTKVYDAAGNLGTTGLLTLTIQ